MLFPCQKGGESKLQLSGSKYVTMLFGNLPPQTYLLKALRDNRNMSSLKLIQRMMVEQFELKLIEFMFKLEDELNIKISDERVDLNTVQDIVTFVDKYISDQKSSD